MLTVNSTDFQLSLLQRLHVEANSFFFFNKQVAEIYDFVLFGESEGKSTR